MYDGKVVSLKEFGAFVELVPGRDGLCHVSELDVGFVKRPEEVVQVGDRIQVKVIGIDDSGRVKLSRKALLAPQEGDGGNGGNGGNGGGGDDRGDRRGGGGDRGPRRGGGDRGRRDRD